ncbi:ABC transporter substrate-binding protein [Siccirubricoccus sp. G192]|uniref:ABC transporter substrate-binding protein n=1 Tax=Siccirubricoccus sp. G192 TaxID=2849651 RepID=UPI001C2B9DBD|nr:ABC transporter substrate-binding protein [Siccirubricoccus sp. G192]MBV1800073.1 ABC transporter substrate-binding protein [Siccirubricoccus sp. G192]
MNRRRLLTAAATTAVLAAPALSQAQRGTDPRVLRFVPQADLTALDPIWTTSTVTHNHALAVYDTLYSIDSRFRPRPQMAEGHTVSDDGLTWRIRLREGLRFHDGEPVRAQDCAASLSRWARRDGLGQILNARVERWGAADDSVIEIRLTRPFPAMLDALGKSFPQVPFMMPERIARMDPNTQITEVVGSGPYRFLRDEFVSGSRVVYAKFNRYVPRSEQSEWGTGGKVAHFERIEWRIIPDAATVAAALQTGEVDWWEQPPPDLMPALAGHRGIQTLVTDPIGHMAFLRFNHLHAPFNDLRARQAVAAALSQEDYMQAINGPDRSLWETCFSLFPCGTDHATSAGAELMQGPRDLARARAMIAEAGLAGTHTVVINPTDVAVIRPMGEITADVLRRLGLNVELAASDWGTVVQRRASREPPGRGGWSVFHSFGQAGNFVNPAVNVLTRGQGANGWPGWYASAEVERLTNEWLDAPTPQARRVIANEIGRVANSDVATIPLGRFFSHTAFRRTLEGVLPGTSPYFWNVRRNA